MSRLHCILLTSAKFSRLALVSLQRAPLPGLFVWSSCCKTTRRSVACSCDIHYTQSSHGKRCPSGSTRRILASPSELVSEPMLPGEGATLSGARRELCFLKRLSRWEGCAKRKSKVDAFSSQTTIRAQGSACIVAYKVVFVFILMPE
jgi:hypothetical protein